MKLSKRKRSTSTMLNMTPMIDIVFLLIIFFMTVSQITRVNDEPLELPTVTGTEELDPTTVTINVNQAGEIIISGKTQTLPEAIGMVVQELAAVHNEPGLVIILIRADRRGTSQTVNELVRELTKLGIQQIRIGTEAPH